MDWREDVRSDIIMIFAVYDNVCPHSGGSAAVFLASYLTLVFGRPSFKAILSLVITLMEGLTLEFDNLFITITVIVGYLYNLNGSSFVNYL